MLADRRIVTGREVQDEVVCVGSLGGGNDLPIGGTEFTKRDIFADRAAEQMNDLADIRDLLAQRAARHCDDVLAVDQDVPGLGVVKISGIRLSAVDLPPPEGPTSAVSLPRWAVKLIPRSTGVSAR